MTRAPLALFATLLCLGTACDAFRQGMEEERARIRAKIEEEERAKRAQDGKQN